MQKVKLNYDILEELRKSTQGIQLEITNVDVKRLRDDRSEIFGGQDIAFVATAAFRATPDGIGVLARKRLEANTVLFERDRAGIFHAAQSNRV